MRLRIAGVAVLLLSLPLAAEANGFRRAAQPVSYYSYYPAMVYYVPAPVAIAPMCLPTMPAPLTAQPQQSFATPTPAPPLGTPPANSTAPPPAVTPPAVKETRSYFDAYGLAVSEGKAADPVRCSVGFWNNTAQPMVLTIDGQPRSLPPGKGVSVDLPRSFVWQVDNRPPRSEQVPADRSGVEIVIRR